ncbi:hypothetical protein FEE95_19365 [Maribacter algarum]|uniref:Periplasmic chaperone for outer membrane proteins Skp n=1 Tax=Maribacter algarum (ex Zhang et al. 2020) TaxID=2578118 RepID=A0A5S3PIQ0_9FLAO|nr:hypothetical protein [Maribacter algarum]TMM53229.1 hypothetical protein FEE95_19365 [Maribacter algarum]
MYSKVIVPIIALLLISFSGNAQDCTLDVGGKNSEMLIKVFQMNAEQITKMEALRAELQIETKVVEDEIQKLFDNHPQSTPDELTTLSEKYKVLQQKIVLASKATDKMLLSSFNEKQYNRYLELCYEAIRKPIKVTPAVLKDSIVDPK